MLFSVQPEPATSSGVKAMFFSALDELSRRYGANADDESVDFAELEPPRGVFLVARDERGSLVGGVALRAIGDEAARFGEVKRLWVRPDARRDGVAQLLMAELERWSREQGYRQLWLETGGAQPEAIALYERLSYTHVEAFPQGVDHYPEGIKFTKVL